MNSRPGEHSSWLGLDNSAKIWPAVLSQRYTTLFRLSVCLERPVRLATLQAALADTMARFPYFNVQIRRGFFWYFFEQRFESVPVSADTSEPCMDAELIGRDTRPLKIFAFNHRVSVEFSHMVTDGTGALNFLRALMCRYFELLGHSVSALVGLPRCGEKPDPREWEDSHVGSALERKARLPKIRPEEDAFHIAGSLVAPGRYCATTGYVSAAEIVSLAKSANLSLTEYIASVLLWCLQEIQENADAKRENARKRRRTRPLRLNIPVNLRPLFGSLSMRNFFGFADPGIDPRLGLYTFEEITQHMRSQLRFQVQEKRMRLMISRNMRGEQPLANRLIPVQLKDMVLGFVYRFLGDRRFTMSLSNLGRVVLPPELSDQISSFVFLPPPNPISKVNCTIITWNDRLAVSFGRMVESSELERTFFRFFTTRGIRVYIESNTQ